MADPYRQVQPGEPVPFSAAAWNAFVDAAKAERQRQLSQSAGKPSPFRDPSIVRVKNETGSDLPRYSVVGLGDPIFTPSDSLDAFLREVTFRGQVPAEDHAGRFAILLEPAASGRAAEAQLAGAIQVLLDVVDDAHGCADVSPGDVTHLITKEEGGSAQVLYKHPEAYYGGLQWGIVRLGTTCSGSSGGGSSGGTADRCACPEDSYEVEVDCGLCGAYYSGGTVMPRYWWLEIEDSSPGDYGYAEPCNVPCDQLVGRRIKLTHEGGEYGGCTWSGRGAFCVRAELAVDGDEWVVTIVDREDCVLAVLRKPVEGFNCCGPNSGWAVDEDSVCDMLVVLRPHECTCCPADDCPPDTDQVCEGTDCCLDECNCVISVTVSNLGTRPGQPCLGGDNCVTSEGEPCNFGDPDCWIVPPGQPPDEACGGMNGVYGMRWASDCTWRFRGVPAGLGGDEVSAELTLSGRTWTLRLLGPDGQTAIFENAEWDCDELVGLQFVGGTCPILGTPPGAVFQLCFNVN